MNGATVSGQVRILALALTALVALAMVSCGGGDDGGSSSPSGDLDLASAKPLFTITYAPGDLQTSIPGSIATGDFNGDGKLDLLLGAPSSDGPNATRTDAGEGYVIFGPITGDIDLTTRQPDVRIVGAVDKDALGSGVAAGDLNHDGVDDIIIGAPNSNGLPEVRTDMGEAYVIFGRSNLPSTVDLLNSEEDFDFQPAEGFSHVGSAFAVADVNADGTDDLIIGAPYAGRQPDTPPGSPRTTVGEVYVVYGAADLHGLATVARNDEDVRLSGITAYDQFGNSVAAADVNGDGTPDIIAGASGYDGVGGARSGAGGTFVFYGGPNLPEHETLQDADIQITGTDAGDSFGKLVLAADVSGDGKAEVIGSSPTAAGPANGRFSSGEAAIVDTTKSSTSMIDLAVPSSSQRIYAPTQAELSPSAMAVMKDSDGVLFALGASMRSRSDRNGCGYAYVVAPAASGDIDIADTASATRAIIGAAAGDDLGTAVAFADVNGDGKDDLLVQAGGPRSILYVLAAR
jgi:hypothetical protein